LAGLLNWGLTYAQTYLTGWVGERILADLRNRLLDHLQRLSLGFFERNRAGVIISRLTNDVEAIDQLVTDGVTSLVQNTLTLVGTAILLFVLDWRLALATLLVIPFMSVATIVFRTRSARAGRGARLRRPPLLPGRRHARDAVRLHALRAELLRPRAAALAALRHLPLGDGGARQDRGRPRPGAGGRRQTGRKGASAGRRTRPLRRRPLWLRRRARSAAWARP